MHDEVPLSVIRAAEARALGASWPAAAEAAGWELSGLRRWIRRFPRPWARELGQARRETRDAAGDEAVAALRRQLRAAEDKTIQSAAATLAARFLSPQTAPRTEAAQDPMRAMIEIANAYDEFENGAGVRELPAP